VRRALALGTLVLAAASLAPSTAGTTSSASRVIDRTLRCAVSPSSFRELAVRVQAGVREFGDRTKWIELPQVSVLSPTAFWAGVHAGSLEDLSRQHRNYPSTRTFWLSPVGCRAVSSRIPLSPRGLERRPATMLGERYQCEVGRAVLVRLRGVFRAPTELRVRRGVHFTAAPVKVGYVAAATASGRTLAYGEVHESGRVRLFLARGCTQE